MRRASLWLLAVTSGVALIAVFMLRSRGGAVAEEPGPKHDWILVYHMAYDNDLSGWGPVILDALQEGTEGSDLVVTVLADDPDKGGLKRYAIVSGGRTVDVLGTDDSASEGVLGDYLGWVAETYPARHYAVVFLDHGGGMDEMCFDQWPGEDDDGGEGQWLGARRAGPVVREFRDRVPGEVELLFLQQCGRASVENLYNFRGAAASVMTSPMRVGAPNTYYRDTLKWLAEHRKADGSSLARQIMSSDDHFHLYTCVDGDALGDLPARLDPVVGALLGNEAAPPEPPIGLPPCYQHEDERNYDLIAWLDAAFRTNHRSSGPVSKLKEWLRDELDVTVAVHPRRGRELKGLSGLSLVVPESAEGRGRYPGYPIYRECRLGELWDAMYPAAGTEAD